MSARWKKVLTVLISVTTAGLVGWLVKAAYDHGNFWLPVPLIVISLASQVIVALTASEEDVLIAKLQREVDEMRQENEIWHKIVLTKLEGKLAIAKQQVAAINRGNMAGVKEWSDVEKSL
jgi:hypothetical protein